MPRCGTEAGYKVCAKRPGGACGECKAALATAVAARKARLKTLSAITRYDPISTGGFRRVSPNAVKTLIHDPKVRPADPPKAIIYPKEFIARLNGGAR